MPFLRRTILGAALAVPTSVRAQLLLTGPDGQEHELRGEGLSYSVPFTYEAGHLLIEASVAGAPPAPFVLDTGSSLTVLDSEFAERTQVRADYGAGALGAGGRTRKGGLVSHLDIRIGNDTLPQRNAFVVPLPNDLLDRGSRPRIAGLIGCNSFGDQALQLDLVKRLVTWLPSADGMIADLIVPMSVQIGADLLGSGGSVESLSVPVTIGGQEQSFVLDTGSPGCILTEALGHSAGLLAPDRPHVDLLVPGGIDGRFLVTAVICEGWSIAGHAISPFVGFVRRSAADNGSSTDARRRKPKPSDLSLFGPSLLRPNQLVVDAPRQRALVSFSKTAPQRPRFQSFGLSLTKPTPDSFEVLSVITGTPAATEGIDPGDHIIAVNDQPARSFSLSEANNLINNAAQIRFRNGRIVRTTSVLLLS
jgi:Aspartyl protease/PDZ domain